MYISNSITDKQKPYKDCIKIIAEFMSLCSEEFDSLEKPNYTTKDYTLHKFQCWVWRKNEELWKYKNRFKE